MRAVHKQRNTHKFGGRRDGQTWSSARRGTTPVPRHPTAGAAGPRHFEWGTGHRRPGDTTSLVAGGGTEGQAVGARAAGHERDGAGGGQPRIPSPSRSTAGDPTATPTTPLRQTGRRAWGAHAAQQRTVFGLRMRRSETRPGHASKMKAVPGGLVMGRPWLPAGGFELNKKKSCCVRWSAKSAQLQPMALEG